MISEINILLIEDDPDDSRMLQGMFEELGNGMFKLELRERLCDGIAALSEKDFHVIMVDLNLPDMQGVDTMVTLQPWSKRLPVIVLTGAEDEAIGLQTLKHGAQDYLVKGHVDKRLLYRAIIYAIERKHAESEFRMKDYAIDSALSAIVFSDLDGNLTYVNESFLKLWGYDTSEEVLGKPITSFWEDMDKAEDMLRKVTEKGTCAGEMTARNRGGIPFYMQFASSVVTDHRGVPLRVMSSFLDISNRIKADKEIQRERDRAQKYLDMVRAIIVVLDREGKIQLINRKGCEVFDCSLEEAVGQNWFQNYLPGRVRRETEAAFIRLISGDVEGDGYFETPVLTSNGEEKAIAWHISVMTDEDGNINGTISAGEDIADRTQTEMRLRESEEKFRSLAEESPNMIFINQRGRIVYANRKCEEIMGYAREEFYLPEFDFLTLVAPEYHEIVKNNFAGYMNGEEGPDQEYTLVSKDGKHIEAILSKKIINYDGVPSLMGILTDISGHKRAEEALTRANSALKTIGAANMALVKATEEAELLHEICRIIVDEGGYPMAWVGYAEDNEERTVLPMAHAGCGESYTGNLKITWDDSQNGCGPTGRAIKTGVAQTTLDILSDPVYAPWREEASTCGIRSSIALPLHSGTATFGALNIYANEPDAFSFEEVGLLTELADDLAYGIMALRDREKRRKAEEVVRQKELYYRSLIENSVDLISVLNLDGTMRYQSPSVQRATGFSLDEMWGKSIFEHIHDEDRQAAMEAFDRVVSGRSEVETIETRRRHKDGSWLTLQAIGKLAPEGSGVEGIIINAWDMTEKKQAAERIKSQLSRLKALHSIEQTIAGSFDLRLTLNVLMEQISSQLGVDAVALMLLSPGRIYLETSANRGFHHESALKKRVRLGKGCAGKVALDRKPLIIPDISLEKERIWSRPFFEGEGFKSYFGVPLITKGVTKGVLELFNRTSFQPDDEWLDFLQALASQAAVAIESTTMFTDLQRSHDELVLAYDTTIEGWAKALDYRDKETEGHSRRVTELTEAIARAMGIQEEELVHVRRGALLHDIGKLGVPDSILLKPGPLDDEEWVIMKRHPVIAHELLSPIAFLNPALDIPYYHHEKWDGSGYPNGLSGEQIPLSARIFAIVDIWDALRSDRPYRAAWPLEKTREYITSISGTQLDPEVVRVFLEVIDQ